ncbi:MAG: phenylalanine--tRNA ligase subunit alpha [Candidatus Colwellbacteria bacterium]|nr:phenylalanine--tRNA ligase subunit alpha [Candidatus Colwellbacteria bacterium]
MDLEEIKKNVASEIEQARSGDELEAIRIKYLGRKQGLITEALKSIADMPIEEKKKFGPIIQKAKADIEAAIKFKENEGSSDDFIGDITLPGRKIESGHLNPITKTENEVRRIFEGLNFSVIDGPELEEEKYNFDSLNIPADHPAREMWDTFWLKPEGSSLAKNSVAVKKKYLLRTHTSPVEIRYMETHEPPFQIISPGRTFRYEATDSTHETNFHQLEGLMIGRDISLANFKFIVEEFFRRFFVGKKVTVRFRSSYFPFVEPGVEVDIKLDNGKWLEVGGAGMTHPNVLRAVKYNPREWQGFAFGFGIERLAMIKYGVPDARLFMSGDLKFTKKF